MSWKHFYLLCEALSMHISVTELHHCSTTKKYMFSNRCRFNGKFLISVFIQFVEIKTWLDGKKKIKALEFSIIHKHPSCTTCINKHTHTQIEKIFFRFYHSFSTVWVFDEVTSDSGFFNSHNAVV